MTAPRRAFDDLIRWVLLVAATALGLAILWDYGFLVYVLENDVSGVSSLIVALFAIGTIYCLWWVWDLSLERRTLAGVAQLLHDQGATSRRRRVDRVVADLVQSRRIGRDGGTDLLLQALQSELRGPVRFGIFASDALYKIGLLGTVIGFILMLVSMRDLGEFDVETMREALQDMTGGMAVALLTTLTGLTCGLLLRMQFNILDNLILKILRDLVRLAEVEIPETFKRERPVDV